MYVTRKRKTVATVHRLLRREFLQLFVLCCAKLLISLRDAQNLALKAAATASFVLLCSRFHCHRGNAEEHNEIQVAVETKWHLSKMGPISGLNS